MLQTAHLETDVHTCYHCGDECASRPISFDEKEFCCEGCKVVYELLAENDLCTYYTLDNRPGISVKDPIASARFAYLNDAKVQQQLLDFQNDKVSKITFHIPQMHCSSCIWLLENLNRLNPGVTDVHVNFLRKEAAVTYEHAVTTLAQVVELMAHIGYEPQITLADMEAPAPRKDRSIYYKLGLAAFCFGNVMLLSFPEYFGGLQHQFGRFFGWLNVLLALPVFLYSARGFFTSAWQGLQQRMINLDLPIAIGLLSLFSVSIYDIATGRGPGFLDSFTGLVFFMLIGKYVQRRTYDSLAFDREYTSYFPISVSVLKNGQETPTSVKELQKGQRILVRNQELIPADSILLRGTANIDYSFVTGESVPVARVAGEVIYAGGRQLGEGIELEVVKEVSQGYLTQLWNHVNFKKEEKQTVENYANAVGKYFLSVTLLIAAGALWYWIPRDSDMAVKAFTSVLVIACPCALSLATPFTLGATLRIFGKQKFFLKNSGVVEAMAKADMVVFDKTGTLTEPSSAEISFVGHALSSSEEQLVRSVLKHSTHPLSQRLYAHLQGKPQPVLNFLEKPGAGLEGIVGDAFVKVGSAVWVSAEVEETSSTKQTRVFISLDGQVRGYYIFQNVYRQGLQELLQELAKTKKLAVLSGDNDSEAPRLRELFGPEAELRFNQSPMQKLEYITSLKEQGRSPIMVGDGLNDAGALRQSDVGLALTDNVTGFSPSCDGILDAKNLSQLARYIRFSQTSLRLILAAFGVSFIYNIIGLTMAVMGEFTPIVSAILMPVSTLSVISFAVLSVKLAAKRAGLR
ncbi:heavy metal translocating P-type ATPase [Rufibacter sediminis]|uniref:Heavy metal translocating P-type ATPase metal-binding domain-containing protein n=1 Tax=Rufibacter sediminis TaxID=2762756 RepID=A0ABR6VQ36_9BACT|nr:heavy metal translocating P-type ATPase metal-binding domain-containing protein [Rufibacter sediminis]MBC3539311.1 heavy metal translocating P-type ATPase metal-binding domain-containing protein [Rufibacter sediminis]